MACFIVPAAEAVVVKVVEKVEEKREQKVVEGSEIPEAEVKIPLSRTENFRDTDWYDLDSPILYADGEVSLSFDMSEPKDPKRLIIHGILRLRRLRLLRSE